MILCDKLCDVLNAQGLIQSFVRHKSRQDMEEMSWRDLSGANIFDMGKYRVLPRIEERVMELLLRCRDLSRFPVLY